MARPTLHDGTHDRMTARRRACTAAKPAPVRGQGSRGAGRSRGVCWTMACATCLYDVTTVHGVLRDESVSHAALVQ